MAEPEQSRLQDVACFYLGTCRVHQPAELLRERQVDAKTTKHRLHSPRQTLQFIRQVLGASRVFHSSNIHLMSEFAERQAVAGQAQSVLSNLEIDIASAFRNVDVFLIEISSLREFPLEQKDGSVIYTDKLITKGAGAKPLTKGETFRTMRDIKVALARPVIWVSHVTPPAGPGLDTVIAVRRKVADAVQAAANALGDHFFDPSTIAANMGAEAFFMGRGADTEHLTPEAVDLVASTYHDLSRRVAAASEMRLKHQAAA